MQKISPFLWFDKNAEEAARYYAKVFKNSKIGGVTRYDEAGAKASGMPVGSVMTIDFEIEGHQFTALNGGPIFKFDNSAISFVINCKDQKEVDYYWEKLTANGGKEVQCGWLADRFGVPWQVVPVQLTKMLKDKNKKKAQRVMQAMLQMKKIDIAALKKAYDGK